MSNFMERQKAAALEQIREQQTEFSRVADIVLPDRGTVRGTRRRVSDVVRLADDYVVEVTDGDEVLWTAVVGDKPCRMYHPRQEQAILHLIATRYDSNPNSNIHAAHYAGRVLGLPAHNA